MTIGKRIHLIDYLKAVSIIMVIITHYSWETKQYPAFTYGIRMAVPIFMILSGYNCMMSYSRREDDSLKALYHPKNMLSKLGWILLPYTILFVFELVANGDFTILNKPLELLGIYLIGGFREGIYGGYYVTLLLEFTLAAPLFYHMMKRIPFIGLMIFLATNIIYEGIVSYTQMPGETYRLILLRYIFLVGFGFYLRAKERVSNVAMLIMFVIGIVYLTAYDYHGYYSSFFIYWRSTCLLAAFYIIPIVYYLFRFCKYRKLPEPFAWVFSMIGASTWHIFLFQMLYYRMHWYDRFMKYELWQMLLITELICIFIGCGSAAMEREIRKAWKVHKTRKDLALVAQKKRSDSENLTN